MAQIHFNECRIAVAIVLEFSNMLKVSKFVEAQAI